MLGALGTLPLTALPKAGAEQEPGFLRESSATVARSVRGGASADILWPGTNNAYQSYDNLRFKVAIESSYQNSVTIAAWADGTNRVGNEAVSLSGSDPSTGTYHRRVFWPPGAPHDVVMRYRDPSGGSWYDCTGGNASNTNQGMVSSTRVHEVRTHNTKSAAHDTNWSKADVSLIVDQLESYIPNEDSHTIDGVYGQCEDYATNGLDKTQWRRTTPDEITITSACADLKSEFDACDPNNNGQCNWQNCPGITSCANAMMDAAGQTGDNNAHIYIINNLGCTSNGISAGGISIPVGNRHWIAIEDQFDPGAGAPPIQGISIEHWATSLLAHEIYHVTDVNHASSDCSSTNMFNRNLMCPNIGRELNTNQCSDIRTLMPYIDRN